MTQPMPPDRARYLPESGRSEPAPNFGPALLAGPMETIDALCLAIGVWPQSTGAQVIRWLDAGCPKADRERLRLGFGLEIRAWELWSATVPRMTPDELRSLLAREGHWLAGIDA